MLKAGLRLRLPLLSLLLPLLLPLLLLLLLLLLLSLLLSLLLPLVSLCELPPGLLSREVGASLAVDADAVAVPPNRGVINRGVIIRRGLTMSISVPRVP